MVYGLGGGFMGVGKPNGPQPKDLGVGFGVPMKARDPPDGAQR